MKTEDMIQDPVMNADEKSSFFKDDLDMFNATLGRVNADGGKTSSEALSINKNAGDDVVAITDYLYFGETGGFECTTVLSGEEDV